MREIEVWSEGYCEQGQEGIPVKAQFHARFKADTFKEALILFKETLSEEDKHYLDIEEERFWICRLFDNGQDARELWG